MSSTSRHCQHSLRPAYQYSGCWLSVQVDCEAIGSIGATGGFVTTSVCNLRKRLRAAHNDGYAWYLAGRPLVREVLGKVLNESLQLIRSLEGVWLDETEQNIGRFDDRYVP